MCHFPGVHECVSMPQVDAKTHSLPSHAFQKHMHMVLTWDHKDPDEYKASARENILANYSTIQFADVGVTKIGKSEKGFSVEDANGKSWAARQVILAVGSSDILPELEGYAELWKKRM